MADPGGLQGLTDAEARLGRERGEANVSPARTSRTYGAILRENVFTFVNNVLFVLGAALVALHEWSDALVAVAVVMINVVVNVVQEVRAKRSLDRIALLTRPRSTVRREGKDRQVDPDEIVRGDLVVLGSGDQVVVDGPLVGAGKVEVDESLLTGESNPVVKSLGDPLYSGSFCVSGSGVYRAEAVGSRSLANKLTVRARRFRHVLTPLQREVNVIIHVLLLVAAFFEIVLLTGAPVHHLSIVDSVKMSVVIAKLVPAGLFLSVTLAYSLGALRIARRGVLVQQVNAIESLSNVDVLCTDKTGTLTANRMALSECFPIAIDETRLRSALGRYAVTTASANGTIRALSEGVPEKPWPLREEIPFSSSRKWSALIVDDGATPAVFVLGAPEMLEGSLQLPADALARAERWARAGLRVVLLARGSAPAGMRGENGAAKLPGGLVALGLAALRDELRPHLTETLQRFKEAGVRLKVISGDNPETVAALARQAGLGEDVNAVSGLDLKDMDREERRRVVEDANVFGRITPDQKEEMLGLLRENGHYVCMIGDGVNDVLSLKRAHLGVAMESGSQATRGVADLVLLGDSFAALPAALEEGQRIRNGMRDVLKLFLTRVLTFTFLLMAIMTIRGFPFSPKHISVLTTLTVGIPSVAVATWARPGPSTRGPVTRSILHFVLPASLMMALAGMAIYTLVVLRESGAPIEQAQTALTDLSVMCGLILLLFLQPPTRWWAGGDPLYRDWRASLLAAALFVVLLALLAIRPAREFFGLAALDAWTYGAVAVAAFIWTVTLRYAWRYQVLERFLGLQLSPHE